MSPGSLLFHSRVKEVAEWCKHRGYSIPEDLLRLPAPLKVYSRAVLNEARIVREAQAKVEQRKRGAAVKKRSTCGYVSSVPISAIAKQAGTERGVNVLADLAGGTRYRIQYYRIIAGEPILRRIYDAFANALSMIGYEVPDA